MIKQFKINKHLLDGLGKNRKWATVRTALRVAGFDLDEPVFKAHDRGTWIYAQRNVEGYIVDDRNMLLNIDNKPTILRRLHHREI